MTTSDSMTRHPWTPGFRWITLDETFVLGIPACRRPYPPVLTSPTLWVSPFLPQEETVNDSLPPSPAISQWLDVQMVSGVTIAQGGVLPNIQAVLISLPYTSSIRVRIYGLPPPPPWRKKTWGLDSVP